MIVARRSAFRNSISLMRCLRPGSTNRRLKAFASAITRRFGVGGKNRYGLSEKSSIGIFYVYATVSVFLLDHERYEITKLRKSGLDESATVNQLHRANCPVVGRSSGEPTDSTEGLSDSVGDLRSKEWDGRETAPQQTRKPNAGRLLRKQDRLPALPACRSFPA